MFFMHLGIQYVPLLIPVLVTLTVTITFYLAYFQYKHVTYLLPYISDTGTYPPESCIFGLCMNFISILIGITMYVRYRQVQEIYRIYNIREAIPINKWSYILGLAACIGISIIGNFQETYVFRLHWGGSVMAFGGGSFYECLQILIYLKISPVIGQKKTTILRIFLALGSFITFLIFSIAAVVSYDEFTGTEEQMTNWRALVGGEDMHQLSTTLEWFCAISIISFVALFHREFKNITICVDVTYKKNSTRQDQNDRVEI